MTKQAVALSLLVNLLAPFSTAFLTVSPTRPFQERVSQKRQQGLTAASLRERCSKRRLLHATRLDGEPKTREDPAPTTAVWKVPPLFTSAGGEAAEYGHFEHDSPVGVSLIDAAAIAAVALAIISYVGPLDSASAAATTSASAELVAQASSVSVDVGAIFAKVRQITGT